MAGFTDAEKVALLLKKMLGAPSTLSTTEAFSEPVRPARSAVFQSQFYAETIPAVAPSDLASVTTDDLGATVTGSVVGKTSSASSMIKKYVKVPLVVIAGTSDMSYECSLNATYGRVLQDAIPYNYDANGSYLYTLYKNDGTTIIPFGSGSWIVDPESGVLTFYDTISGVTSSLPPKISFYRYVGSKGAATSTQATDAIQSAELVFTKPITFQGGDETKTDDTLAAIVLDDRNLATLSVDVPCDALQIGGDYDGSWRVTVCGGGGSATATSFNIECRVSGAWVTKSSFTPV
jgi:hypothetical protein